VLAVLAVLVVVAMAHKVALGILEQQIQVAVAVEQVQTTRPIKLVDLVVLA
jgi:hypothetical protein